MSTLTEIPHSDWTPRTHERRQLVLPYTPEMRDWTGANERRSEIVIPNIDSDLFVGHETARFAVGIVAVGNNVLSGLKNEFKGYGLLRGNVYAKKKHFMPVTDLNSDGTETDHDDGRSVHFAVIENTAKGARTVGAMRLVIKSHENSTPLPIENHYPEVFTTGPAPLYSTEASRLIGQHENRKIQRGLKWLLFTAGVSYIADHQLSPVYGAVERSLARGLQQEGMPVTILGEPKWVEEFHSKKQAIRIDMEGLTRKLEADQPELLDAMQVLTHDFVYSGVAE